VAALVPLIGVVALGAEAGSWYVTKQNAQNAADAAAYSGGLRLACSFGASQAGCDTSYDYIYRARQFANQNKFCDSAGSFPCTSSPPAGTTQTVQIDQPAANRVRAIVTQQQPAYLATVLGLSTVNIGAQAIAEVQNPKGICGLALGPATNGITIGGSSNITGNGCSVMSNTAAKFNSAPTFTGSGWTVNAVNGCSGGHCDVDVPHNYNALPATNPLSSKLDSAPFNSRTGPVTKPCGNGKVTNMDPPCSLSGNSGSGVYSDLAVNGGGTLNLAPGETYFFYNAAISFSGTVTGTGITFVLLGDSSITINAGAAITLSAPATNSFDSRLNGVLIDDQAPNKSKNAVTINGGATVQLGGVMYFPNVDVTWGGTAQNPNLACTEVIANSLTITGNSYLSTQDCAAGTTPQTQAVALVE
jgi:hypothetical protein